MLKSITTSEEQELNSTERNQINIASVDLPSIKVLSAGTPSRKKTNRA